MDDETKKRLRDIVDVLREANKRAHSSYLYAKQMDSALQNLRDMPEISSQFQKTCERIRAESGKIPQIALLEQQYAATKKSLDRIAEKLK